MKTIFNLSLSLSISLKTLTYYVRPPYPLIQATTIIEMMGRGLARVYFIKMVHMLRCQFILNY